MSFPHYHQPDAMDCGPTCLRMIAKYFGKHFSGDTLRQISGFGKEGVSLLGISDSAERIGFRTRGVLLSYRQLVTDANLPAILHWGQNHFVVMLPNRGKNKIRIADPAKGFLTFTKNEFLQKWISTQSGDE